MCQNITHPGRLGAPPGPARRHRSPPSQHRAPLATRQQVHPARTPTGPPAAVTLLYPSGNNEEYARPSGQGRYIGVPVELWTHGWILRLNSTALALLLVLLEHQGGHTGPRYLLSHRRERYALSPDTWTMATKDSRTTAC